jgi:hypothetical protein
LAFEILGKKNEIMYALRVMPYGKVICLFCGHHSDPIACHLKVKITLYYVLDGGG